MYTYIVQGAELLYIKPSLNALAALSLSPQGNPNLNIICHTIKHDISPFHLRGVSVIQIAYIYNAMFIFFKVQ